MLDGFQNVSLNASTDIIAHWLAARGQGLIQFCQIGARRITRSRVLMLIQSFHHSPMSSIRDAVWRQEASKSAAACSPAGVKLWTLRAGPACWMSQSCLTQPAASKLASSG